MTEENVLIPQLTVEEAKKLNRKNITLLINRRGEMIFFTVKLEDDLKEKTPAAPAGAAQPATE